MVDYQAEHGGFPDFVRQCGRNPLLTYGFVGGRVAWKGECGVCEGRVADSRAPGDVVSNPVGVFVFVEGGEVDGWRGGSGSVAGLDREAFGYGAVGVTVWRVR